MSKALIFDMDGTIADLYGVENWLDKLLKEDTSPYSDASPIYTMEVLNSILELFRRLGYRIIIVSWGAKNGTPAYTRAVKKVKIAWLAKCNFLYDEIHVVKYGTPKQKFIKTDLAVLVDDNAEVRNSFLKSRRGKKKEVIDATENIIEILKCRLLAE